jgi:hypothetical protein
MEGRDVNVLSLANALSAMDTPELIRNVIGRKLQPRPAAVQRLKDQRDPREQIGLR